jgi:hypothetical protein
MAEANLQVTVVGRVSGTHRLVRRHRRRVGADTDAV